MSIILFNFVEMSSTQIQYLMKNIIVIFLVIGDKFTVKQLVAPIYIRMMEKLN